MLSPGIEKEIYQMKDAGGNEQCHLHCSSWTSYCNNTLAQPPCLTPFKYACLYVCTYISLPEYIQIDRYYLFKILK